MKIPDLTSVALPRPRIPQRRAPRVALMAVAALVVAALVAGGVRWATALPADAALRAADATVTEAQLTERLKTLEALYGIRAPEDPAQSDQFRRESAKAVAVDMVIQQAAQERDIVTAERQARDTLNRAIEQKGPDGRRQFVELLGRIGASEQNVVDELVRQQNTGRLYQQVTKDQPEVSEEDIRKAFDERRAHMAVPEQRKIRNIVLKTKEEATAAMGRAAGGEDFGGVARQLSLDTSTRDQGGDLGVVAGDQLEAGFADAAFAAKPNSLFGPVQTRFGWNVGQVQQVVPAKPLSFEQVHDELGKTLKAERALAAWRGFLTERIQAADVEYADAYRPADPESPPRQPGAPASAGTGQAPQPPR